MASISKRYTKDGEVRYMARIRHRGEKPLTVTFRRKIDADTWVLYTERYFDLKRACRESNFTQSATEQILAENGFDFEKIKRAEGKS